MRLEGRGSVGGTGSSRRSLALRILGAVDGDLDGDLASSNLLALQGRDGLLLLILRANIDEAVALGAAGLTPAAADNAGRDDVDTGLGEERGQAGIVDGETEVGDEKHVLGGLAFGSLASGADNLGLAGSLGGLLLLLAFSSSRSRSSRSVSGSSIGRSSGVSISRLLLALREMKREIARVSHKPREHVAIADSPEPSSSWVWQCPPAWSHRPWLRHSPRLQ